MIGLALHRLKRLSPVHAAYEQIQLGQGRQAVASISRLSPLARWAPYVRRHLLLVYYLAGAWDLYSDAFFSGPPPAADNQEAWRRAFVAALLAGRSEALLAKLPPEAPITKLFQGLHRELREEAPATNSLASSAAELSLLELISSDLYSAGHFQLSQRASRFEFRCRFHRQTEKSLADYLPSAPWTYAIGHYTYLDLLLKAKALGLLPALPTAVEESTQTCNRPLRASLEAHVTLVNAPPAGSRALQINRFPTNELSRESVDSFLFSAKVNSRWFREGRPPLAMLPDRLVTEAREILERNNYAGWFATLHIRDGGFWKDYSDVRCCEAATYLEAIRSVTSRGGLVFRLGDTAMPPLPKMPGLIDYAHSPLKSPLLDTYLAAHTSLHIGTVSGMSCVPGIFGRPTIYTNVIPLGSISPFAPSWYLPKLVRDQSGRALSLEEMLGHRLGTLHWRQRFDYLGLEPIDNTAEEIAEVVEDFFAQSPATFFARGYVEENNPAQLKAAKVLRDNLGNEFARIGSRFLQRHPELAP